MRYHNKLEVVWKSDGVHLLGVAVTVGYNRGDKRMEVREYVDDYSKYYPERWRWELKNTNDQNKLFMRTRARRSKDCLSGRNMDLLPDFYSIERDAAQFGIREVEWTDFFGLVWKGRKGVFAMAGAPNYQGSLYYYDKEESWDDDGYSVSDQFDAYKNQPPEEVYTKIIRRGVTHWIDTAHVVDTNYKYVVNNHLFKDTYVELIYEDGEIINVYGDYKELIIGLLKCRKEEIVKKILKSMNEHFIKLRDSDREELRKFYPGKTAEEMFLEQSL